jgi:hypothetical protein
VEIEYIGAEDDKVFAILNWEGTRRKTSWAYQQVEEDKGAYRRVMRIENGKFAEHWDVVDETICSLP